MKDKKYMVKIKNYFMFHREMKLCKTEFITT